MTGREHEPANEGASQTFDPLQVVKGLLRWHAERARTTAGLIHELNAAGPPDLNNPEAVMERVAARAALIAEQNMLNEFDATVHVLVADAGGAGADILGGQVNFDAYGPAPRGIDG